jgi:hypothetical protein
MRTRGITALAALALLAGCTTAAPGRPGPPATTTVADTMPVEAGPIVLGCADAARGIAPPSPADLHVEGLASDGWRPLPALPDIAPVSAGGRPYRFVKAFLYLTPQAAPLTTVTVVSPPDALLYYTAFGIWSAGNPFAPTVPHGPSRQLRVGTCPDDGSPTGYTGGVLISGPACVTLRFARSDSRTGRTATFRFGVRSC